MSFRRIALIGKPRSAESESSLQQLREFLRKRGCEVLPEGENAGSAKADLAIVIGGDGTMLAAARDLVRHHVPLVGINQGRLGFMTDIGLHDMQTGIGAILDGKYAIEERSLLDAEITRAGKSMLRTIALNEAVIGKGSQGRLIEFELRVDDEFVYRLRADGIIVATPTGSTAYALSAQGPILHPAVPALTLVPLNPHTLSARPVSVSDRCRIDIVMVHSIDARAHFDGLALHDMAEGDHLILQRSADAVRFVHPPGYHYFATLREKLGWSEAIEKRRATD
ncbi:MAG TPA: NAD(+)/NADH kinase [Burkholderiales bacterium]|jgi:NAD+ kinase|nr:NAD(+)/NADH kinase [Burkholderiales bacterium]